MRFNRPSILQIISVFLLSYTVRALDFPSTIDGFSFFMVFDTPILESGTRVDASRYNLVWGASDRILPMYKETNPDITVAHYMPWSRDPDGTHDLAYWQATKPEWVLYQCDKKTPAYLAEDRHMPLDISNPDVIDWQLTKYIGIVNQFGYNGIAADNFAVGNAMKACGIWRGDVWVAKYDGRWEDPNYTVDALNWITTFYAKLKSVAPEISFGINYSLNEMSPFDSRVMSVVDHTDYVLDEAGFTKWGFGKPTAEKWEDISVWIDNIQSHGKHYFGINEFPDQVTVADHEWGMASYLMSKNQASSMVNTIVQGYGRETYLQQYVNLKIGEPIGKRYVENGLNKRKYSNGFVFINLSNEDKTVTLPEDGFKYKDVSGNTYAPEKGSFTIKAQTGLVLGATTRPPTTTISTTTTTTGKHASTTGKASSSGSNPTPQNPASTSGFAASGASGANDNSDNSSDNTDSSPVISGSGEPRPASTTGGLEEDPTPTSSSSSLSPSSSFVIVFVCIVSMALLL